MELGATAAAAAPRNNCPTAHHQRSDDPTTARFFNPYDAVDATGYRDKT